MSSFEALGLLPELIRAVEEHGWHLPRDVQDEAIPLILGGNHVMICAETGSGKTGALALPVMQLLHETLTGAAEITRPTVQPWTHTGGSLTDPANYALTYAMNVFDRDPSVAVLCEQCLVQTREDAWAGVRATVGAAKGKLYWEVRCADEGLVRVGVATRNSSLNIGTDTQSWGYGGTGKKSHAGSFADYGCAFGAGDTVGVYLDMDAGTLAFWTGHAAAGTTGAVSGEDLGEAFSLPRSTAVYPALAMRNAEATYNFTGPFLNVSVAAKGYVPFAQLSLRQSSVFEAWRATTQPAKAGKETGKGGDKGVRGPVRGGEGVLAVIVEPTRELAIQVYDELLALGKHLQRDGRLSLRVGLATSGKDARVTPKAELGACDVLVGTLGVLEDALVTRAGGLTMERCRFLVLDEADTYAADRASMASVRALHSAMPHASQPTQVVVCSATLHSPEIRHMQSALGLEHASFVDLKGRDAVPENVDHVCYTIDPATDPSWLPVEWRVHPPQWLQEAFEPAFPAYDHAANAKTAPSAIYARPGKGDGKKFKNPDCLQPTDARVLTAAYIAEYTDGVHAALPATPTSGMLTQMSLGTKLLKLAVLKRLLDTLDVAQAIIFCRTRVDCDNVVKFLTMCDALQLYPDTPSAHAGSTADGKRYSSTVLHGGSTARSDNYQQFKAGDIRYLACTDVAARGLDVKGLPLVVNMTLPDAAENYIHRVGRTGRVGAYGMAVSLVSSYAESVWFHKCRNKGIGCSDARCIVQYSEVELLGEIEARLHQELAVVGAAELAKGKECIFNLAEQKRPIAARVGDVHVAIVAPQSKQLYAMELDAQRSYLNEALLAYKWANTLRSHQ